jgi:hypothetical protein
VDRTAPATEYAGELIVDVLHVQVSCITFLLQGAHARWCKTTARVTTAVALPALANDRNTLRNVTMRDMCFTESNVSQATWLVPQAEKKRGYMVCTGNYVATNTRKQRSATSNIGFNG